MLDEIWRTGSSLRRLLNDPAFAVPALLLLALGIGSTISAFGALDRLLLAELPYPNSSQLLAIQAIDPGDNRRNLALATIDDWHSRASTLAGLAGYRRRSFGMTSSGPVGRERPLAPGRPAQPVQPVRVIQAGLVTHAFFDVLGVPLRRGRDFDRQEELQDRPVAVVSARLWSELGGASDRGDAASSGGSGNSGSSGDAGSLGSSAGSGSSETVMLNEVAHQIIGVLSERFEFEIDGRTPDLYIPISHADYGGSHSIRALRAVARAAGGRRRTGLHRDRRSRRRPGG